MPITLTLQIPFISPSQEGEWECFWGNSICACVWRLSFSICITTLCLSHDVFTFSPQRRPTVTKIPSYTIARYFLANGHLCEAAPQLLRGSIHQSPHPCPYCQCVLYSMTWLELSSLYLTAQVPDFYLSQAFQTSPQTWRDHNQRMQIPSVRFVGSRLLKPYCALLTAPGRAGPSAGLELSRLLPCK